MVSCLSDKKSPGSSAVITARIAPKICQDQLPTMYSEYSRFPPNRFTFGRVIAERVNTAKTRRKVNPIFGWRLASSRIINHYMFTYFITILSEYACKLKIKMSRCVINLQCMLAGRQASVKYGNTEVSARTVVNPLCAFMFFFWWWHLNSCRLTVATFSV